MVIEFVLRRGYVGECVCRRIEDEMVIKCCFVRMEGS